MKLKTKLFMGVALTAALVGLGLGQSYMEKDVIEASAQTLQAPAFEVDPFWPQPLPNEWILGNVIGVAVDARDHVYIVHRAWGEGIFKPFAELGLSEGTSICCEAAPPIVEFDPDGNMVRAWGGPVEGAPYVWPESNHGIEVDHKGNVWIGGNGRADSHILKFTNDGKFLQQLGTPGLPDPDSNDTSRFSRVAKISVVEETNEAFIADGYGNRRIAVLDADTGAFKRYWGAYGEKNIVDPTERYRHDPSTPPSRTFTGPVHCVEPSDDGLLYVCDRTSDRIQVFDRAGNYKSEVLIAPETGSQGSTWDLDFSRDAAQKYIYLADGQNQRVYIIDRASMEVLTQFGGGGRQPGLWFAPHSLATDSKGNIYTTETYEGKRIQKFMYKGIKDIPKMDQGALWPAGELNK
jgi:DNA-binding beta-propeller fold protein YncE